MTDHPDYTQKVIFDDTAELTVKQDTPADLRVEIHQPATKETFKVIQSIAANLKATVTQSSLVRSVVNAIAANLQVEIHQPGTKETFQVIQAVAASLKATVTQAAKDRTVTNATAANLKGQVEPISGAEFLNYPRIPTGATQVDAYATANNSTVVIHTVTAGKTFFLNTLTFSNRNQSGAVAAGYISVNNDSQVFQYRIFNAATPDGDTSLASASFPFPLELASGWEIVVQSEIVSLYTVGFIHGYEV